MVRRKKPNIAIVTLPHSPHFRSAKVILTNFLQVLDPISNRIFVITGNFLGYMNSDKESKVFVKNIMYDSSKDPAFVKIVKCLAMHMRMSYNLFRILLEEDVDVTFFFLASPLLLSMLTTKLLRQETLVVATGSASKSAERTPGVVGFFFSRILMALEKITFMLATKIVVESKSVMNFLGLTRYKQKIAICFGAGSVNTGIFKVKKNVMERRNLIGYVGRLSPEKGVINLLAAIPKILDACGENVEFMLVGDGPLSDEIEDWIRRNCLYNKVKLEGWMPHNTIPDYLNEFKLLILPSYTEGLPNVVLEAMASGAIVLATPVGGIPDLIEDEQTGFIMKDNSPESIAKVVARALNHPKLGKITESAHALIESKYSYQVVVRRYKDLLASLG